jgi:hypothetical protein
MKNQMQQANDDLEDRLEGVYDGVQVAWRTGDLKWNWVTSIEWSII